ncbi:MAG: hypothetical protein N2381_11095, partial [Armatimonadetes bacterium]|nr:hypothetical protein [Armatimonadota bacterium]
MQGERLRSRTLWKDEFSGNLAIFCSDERFAGATIEFLKQYLGMERCDLFVVAGGPAFIAQNEPSLVERLELLIEAHKIKYVALIAHEDCGYYKRCYPDLSQSELKRKQVEDLSSAISLLRQKGILVCSFFALVESDEVVFE